MPFRSINKKVKSLFEEVIVPYWIKRRKDKRVNELLKGNELAKKFSLNVARMAVFIVIGHYEKALELFELICNSYKNVDRELFKEYLEFFFNHLTKWMKKNYSDDEIKDYFEIEKKFFDIFNQHFKEDDFFDFDSFDTEEKEKIDTMHYKEHQKISAQEFMSDNHIDRETIDELNDLEEEIEHAKYLDFSDKYIGEVKKILQYFIKIFELNYEFTDLAYALEVLYAKLDICVEESKKDLFKAYLDSILDDLEKWADEVIFKQEAKDIHYLDASLLANIAQIDILFSSTSSDNEDLEFF